MANSLTADQVEEILELYAETENKKEVAEETDRSYETVTKYVNQAIEEGDRRMPEVPSDPGEITDKEAMAEGPGDSPFEPDREQFAVDVSEDMTPGDFIKEFFEDFEVGVKGTWVAIQSRRADRRQLLPTKDSLKKDLLTMSSGISQSALMEAEYICEEYWAEAQRFLRRTGYEAEGTPYSGTMQGGNMGGQGMGGGQQGFGNQFIGQGGGQMGGQGQAMGGGANPAYENRLARLEDKIDKMAESSQGSNDGRGTLAKLRELQEEKKILEELSGGDDRLDQIEQTIQALQQQVLEASSSSQPVPPSGGDGLEDRVLRLAAESPDVSLREALDFISERESEMQNPEVLEKKHEKEIEEMKMEARHERQEKIADTLGNLFDRVGEGIGRQLVSDDGGEESETADTGSSDHQHEVATDGAPAQPPQQNPANQQNAMQAQGMQPQMEVDKACPHCDSPLQPNGGGLLCENCEYGVASCDLCGLPVEIPPRGEAQFGKCGRCEEWLDADDAEAGEIECDDCGWEGGTAELRGEGLLCENCGNVRPIARQPNMEDAEATLNEILE